jgi:hypothetical protein
MLFYEQTFKGLNVVFCFFASCVSTCHKFHNQCVQTANNQMQKITDIAANFVSYPNYRHTEHLHITHFITFHVPSFLLMSQQRGTDRRFEKFSQRGTSYFVSFTFFYGTATQRGSWPPHS